jgi:hypothetical protein
MQRLPWHSSTAQTFEPWPDIESPCGHDTGGIHALIGEVHNILLRFILLYHYHSTVRNLLRARDILEWEPGLLAVKSGFILINQFLYKKHA